MIRTRKAADQTTGNAERIMPTPQRKKDRGRRTAHGGTGEESAGVCRYKSRRGGVGEMGREAKREERSLLRLRTDDRALGVPSTKHPCTSTQATSRPAAEPIHRKPPKRPVMCGGASSVVRPWRQCEPREGAESSFAIFDAQTQIQIRPCPTPPPSHPSPRRAAAPPYAASALRARLPCVLACICLGAPSSSAATGPPRDDDLHADVVTGTGRYTDHSPRCPALVAAWA
jgi:hypothetical protein